MLVVVVLDDFVMVVVVFVFVRKDKRGTGQLQTDSTFLKCALPFSLSPIVLQNGLPSGGFRLCFSGQIEMSMDN